MLKTQFVSYAGDKWYLSRQQDDEGRFFRKVAEHRKAAQGVYAATPEGAMLRDDHFHPSPDRLLTLLSEAHEAWRARKAPDAGAIPAAFEKADPNYARTPPKNGLILTVFSRIPTADEAAEWTPNRAQGRDHLWLTEAERDSLLPPRWEAGLRYPVPPVIAERLLRFHLMDNVRGEPPFWGRDEIRENDLWLVVEKGPTKRLRLEGTARLATVKDGGRGYDARVQGYIGVEGAGQKIARFDVLAWGEAWGEGTYTKGAPKGRYPLLIAVSLAGGSGADRVPPQGTKHFADYFGR